MKRQCYNLLYCFTTIFLGTMVPSMLGAQERRTYSGLVSDSAGPVASANVFIVNEDSVLLSFAITGQDGAFQISISRDFLPQSLWIEATCIGYRKSRTRFDAQKGSYEISLERDPVYLREVTVTNRPTLLQAGDTLRYIVSSFAEKEDRSIGDVLRRMPGIKIMEDGTIYYNDKQIDNLYIHGDDLMSGKYGVATKVIRKEMIKSVDVIQNHQPIKVLKDKVFSDKASVNLVLADENSIRISGGGTIGLGIPGLYDIRANSILLNKKVKSVNLAALNNAGNDYRSQLNSQGSGNMAGNIDKDIRELTLSMSTAPYPNISQQYYFDNHSQIFNFNNLYNLKNGFQLKLNAKVFRDVNHFIFNGSTKNFAAGDTIVYLDDERIRNNPKSANGTFQILANKERYYFSSTTSYTYWRDANSSQMKFNDISFSQSLLKTRHAFSNDIHWIPAFRSGSVFEVRWLLKNETHKNQLTLYDGYVSSISGHEGLYDSVIQKLKDPVFQSHIYLSIKRSWKWGTVYQNAGWITEKHLMRSSLIFLKNGRTSPYSGDPGNDQHWRSNEYYSKTGLDFKTNQWSGTLQMPVTLRRISDVQKLYGFHNSTGKILFNPKWTLRHQIDPERQATLNYSYSTEFGEFANTYIGKVLRNYRNISSSEGILPYNKIHNSSLNYAYQKSIQLFFLNAGMSYSHIAANTMLAADIEDSIEQTEIVMENNVQKRWSSNAGISKFIFPLKLNTSLKLGYTVSSSRIILNGNATSIKDHIFSTSVMFSKRFSDHVSLEYSGRYELAKVLFSGNSADQQAPQKVRDMVQTIKTSFTPGKRLLIDLVVRNAIQKNNFITQDYLFSDAKVRYTFSRKKFDVNVEAYNLFNVKDYIYFNADGYRLLSNQYHLRGRMIMAKVEIYF